ncbi:MAG: 30S ribosomal protein S18 [Actinomycetota bacterium]|nr:30S ribosomal protein S18 [Actinomycetota bacterium]
MARKNKSSKSSKSSKSNRSNRSSRNAAGNSLNLRKRKRFCYFCKENIDHIDYKNVSMLGKFISDKGKIRPRRSTGNCVQHQKKIAMAIKRARVIALIPYYKR